MNPSAAPAGNPDRNWKRFSIRGLLVLTTCFASFLAYRTHIARREKPALDLVREHGCTPRYQHDIFGNFPSPAPRFLREAIGVENFGSAVRLNFADGMPQTDEAFSMLDRLPNVNTINTNGSTVSDEGLTLVSQLSKLCCLRLSGATRVSDPGLRHLRALDQLKLLDLSGSAVTDQGISELQGLTRLEILVLTGTQVSDAGIMRLSGLKSLQLLRVQGTPVTQEGVHRLQEQLPNCEIEFGP